MIDKKHLVKYLNTWGVGLLCVLAAPLAPLSAGGLNVFAFHTSWGIFSPICDID